MDFVVKILIMFLNKTSTEAQSLMLKVHNEGSAVCGLFPIDVAKTIQKKIHNYSSINHQPLNVLLNNYGNFYKIFRKSISNAFALASEKNHQYVTLEHLLFSLMDEEDALMYESL